MVDQSTTVRQERRVQTLVVTGLVVVFGLTAFAPHNERALFIDPDAAAARAFNALALPIAPPSLKRFGWLPRAEFARSFPSDRTLRDSQPTARRTPKPDEQFVEAVAPTAELPVLGSDATQAAGPPEPVRLASAGGGTGGDGFGITGIVPGAPAGGGGGGGDTAENPTPTPTPSPTPTAPTAVVPEPSTWTMLVLGFMAIGVGLRRRRHVEALRSA